MGRRESRHCFCYWMNQSSDLSKNPWRVDLVILLNDSARSSVAEISLFNLFFPRVISSFSHSFTWAIVLSFIHFVTHSFIPSLIQPVRPLSTVLVQALAAWAAYRGRQGQREREGHRAMVHSGAFAKKLSGEVCSPDYYFRTWDRGKTAGG